MTFLHSVLASQFACSFREGKEDGCYVDYCITISEYWGGSNTIRPNILCKASVKTSF